MDDNRLRRSARRVGGTPDEPNRKGDMTADVAIETAGGTGAGRMDARLQDVTP
jgi:hypothetical protein